MLWVYGRKDLINILKLIDSVQSGINCYLDREGMKIEVVDCANISIVAVKVPRIAFKAYAIDKPVNFKILLTAGSSRNLIKTLESLTWDLITLKEISENYVYFECGYANITVPQDYGVRASPRIPNLPECTCEYQINSADLYKYVNVIKTAGSETVFTEKGVSTFHSENTISIDLDSALEYIQQPRQTRTLIDTKFLLNVLNKIKKFSYNVNVGFSTNYPLNLFCVGERGEEIKVIIAPRLED